MRNQLINIISSLVLYSVFSHCDSPALTSTQRGKPQITENESTTGDKTRPEIELALKNNDVSEIQTKEQLQRLIETYNLKKWFFTSKIIIDSDIHTIPHSHPILTLNTRHLKDDELLLATFIHEQLHWFISRHSSKEAILSDLTSMYPVASKEYHETVEWHTGNYFHIVICYLEYKILKDLLGELKAYQVIEFWQNDHYQSIYRIIVEDQKALESLVKKFDLMHNF